MMDLWVNVAGQQCQVEGCSNPATHLYGNVYVCCQCHGGDFYSPEEAAHQHARIIEQQKNAGEES